MKLITLFLIVLSTVAFGQSDYFVKDFKTEQPIPFVKVFPSEGTPFLADIDGKIEVPSEVNSIRLRSSGYRDTIIQLADVSGEVLFMQWNVQEIEEVKVVPGVNPAHRIVQQAIDRRKQNHPLENDAFTYNSYSKFVFDINRDALEKIPDNETDSGVVALKEFFGQQHLLLMESASKRSFQPPYRDKEEIIAYKVSGFSDPTLSTFANGFQSFSFYDNQFDLLGKQYINPIARGGIRRYLFILEDSTVINGDTTFTIFYRPRKGKNFDGMTGRMYINSNGYAIEKVIAAPYEEGEGFQLKIVQEYKLIDGKKWFPEKLSTEIEFPGLSVSLKVPDAYIQGRGNTYIEDVQLNPEMKKIRNRNVTLSTAEDANELDEGTWDTIRKYEATSREKRTYQVIDSISEAYKLDQRLNGLSTLLKGKIPIKYFNIDLWRMLNYSTYEGYRLGLGLETSDRLSKRFNVGGYFGWGTKDKDWKWGGYSTVHFSRKHGVNLKLRYQEDLLERGGHEFSLGENISLKDAGLFRYFYITQMERQRLAEVVFSTDIKANIELKLIGNYQRIWFNDAYSFMSNDTAVYRPIQDFDLAETGVEITWNFGEKYMLLGTEKFSMGRKFPQLRIKAIRGWKDWFESDYDYWRFNAQLTQSFGIRSVGVLKLKLAGSKTIGSVPLTLMQIGNGTGEAWNVSAVGTFETMTPAGFFATEQASMFVRMNFLPFKTKAKWNEPQIILHSAAGFGTFNNRGEHNWTFDTMEKGYYEAGLALNGIWTPSTLSLGLGGFYRFGPYSNSDWTKNIVPKIVFTTSF